jgi:hypothetical protein
MRYLIPALDDLGEMFKGRRIAPIEFYETGCKSLLTSFGYQGISMIAVTGRDIFPLPPPVDAVSGAAVRPIQIAYTRHIAFVLAPARRIGNVSSDTIPSRDNAYARTLNKSNILLPRSGWVFRK